MDGPQLPKTSTFAAMVKSLVAQIPEGSVMTYGQIAALCGSPRSSRVVGGIAHFTDPSLPWHRVVNKKGRLASGYPGGRRAQQERLAVEGLVSDKDFTVDIDRFIWWPPRSEEGPIIVNEMKS